MKLRYILVIITILSLMLAKVYVANELYYTSRNIQKLSIQINALKEERNILKLKIEKLKYKNTIIDPLFKYKPKEPKKEIEEIQINEIKEIDNIDNNEDKNIKKHDTKELFEKLNVDEGLI